MDVKVRKSQTMKKVYSLALVVIVMTTGFACKKDHDGASSPELTGYWELAQAQGDIPTVNYPAGNGSLLVIKDDTYAYYGNGQLVKSGAYTTTDDNTVVQSTCLITPEGKFTRRIVFDTAYSATKVFYQVENDQLALVSGCFATDGGQKITYRRVEPNGTFPLE
jgi:hypothetical protein